MDDLSQLSHSALGASRKSCFRFLSGVLSILGGFDEVERPTAPDYGADNEPARCGFATSRMVHAYAIAYLMSRPGADLLVDHGIIFSFGAVPDP